MAEELRLQRIKPINKDGIERIIYPPIAKQWVNRFLAHHPDLQSKVGKAIDTLRLKVTTKDALIKWFNDVRKIFEHISIQKTYIIWMKVDLQLEKLEQHELLSM